MATTKEWKCLWATWLVLAIGLVIRLILSNHFLLAPDEANYWQWSRYLDFGYHDHPPMIAWTIWLATTVFGHSEFAVRLPTILGISLTSVYMCLLASYWFSRCCAFHIALLTQGLLLFNGSALIATPDGLLLPCWAAACYHAALALDDNTPSQWIVTGIWFGLGMLSKYTMLLFLPSLFLCMFLHSDYRRLLLSRWPWIGLSCSVIIFTPVLFWNANNEWATFRHVLYQGGLENKNFFSLHYIGDFFGTQLALLSPLVLCMIIVAWLTGHKRRRINPRDAHYLTWMSITGFVVFLGLSLHVRIYGNWPAPAYITALILITALYSPDRTESAGGKGRMWKLTLAFAYGITLPILIQIVYPIMPLSIDLDRTARETVGWDELGKRVNQELQAMVDPDNTFIYALRYQYASELAFYMPGQPRTLSINQWTRPNVYDFWFDDSQVLGKDAVGITEWKGMADSLRQVFAHVDPPEEIKLYRESPWRGSELVHTFYLIRGYDFKGGLRWQPKDKDDIRATKKQTENRL